jgi:hypothetical protein
MRCTVLKAFPYSHDGIHIEDLAEGVSRDMREDLVPGLIAEGFVKRDPAELSVEITGAEKLAREKAEAEALLAARGAVVIPGELPTKFEDMREIAVQLTDETVKSKDDALAAINAEIARRADLVAKE